MVIEKPHRIRHTRRRGAALLIVLAVLSLLVILVLGLLSMTSTEQHASAAFSDTVDSRALSELAVDLAIAQIRKATEENSVSQAGTSGQHRTWASQPGMIRVYGTEEDRSGFRAQPVAAYKLYSDDQLVWTAQGSARSLPAELAADRGDLDGWQEHPALFTDLNEPARVVLDAESGDSRLIHPIIDPAAYDPGNSDDGVAGFSYQLDDSNLGTSSTALPMPVRWIYVLKDGQLTTPTRDTDGVADFSSSSVVPTSENPIVGRIAFWADDESCKVNINTASEGDYWDTPRANNETDNRYARRVPATGEYNRYPGHPALTCLSPVYRAFDENLAMPADLSEAERRARMRVYAALSPHVGWGGTLGGTQDTSNVGSASPAPVSSKRTRLYATVDELFFSPERIPYQDTSIGGATSVDLDNEDFQIGKAFLTAHSKAPELNLFNKPKISLWPQSRNASERNAIDRLIAFCNRAGDRQWQIDRSANYKSHSSPGSAQSATSDLSGRNDAMLDAYLVYLTGQSSRSIKYEIPGFGSTMRDKYGTNKTNQIIISSVDLLRWGVNSYSTGLGRDYTALPSRGNMGGATNPGLLGETSAIGLRWRGCKGFGRFPTVTEAAIVFMATDAERDSDGNFVDDNKDGFADHTTKMRAFWLLEPFSPTVGPPSWSANVIYKLSGLQAGDHGISKADGSSPVSFGWTGDPQLKVNYPNGWFQSGHTMSFLGIPAMLMQADQSGNNKNRRVVGSRNNRATDYTFASEEIDVTSFYTSGETTTPLKYEGGTLQIELIDGFDGTEVVQKVAMEFPATTLTLPQIYLHDATQGDADRRFNDLDARLRDDNPRETLIRPGDRVRAVIVDSAPDSPSGGDLRLIAGRYEVPKSYFTPHPNYDNSTVPCAHGLRHSRWRELGTFGWTTEDLGLAGRNYQSAPGFFRFSSREVGGSLIEDMVYARDCWPSVSTGLNGALKRDGRPGDWNTGTGRIEDGPYIGKPDEGNTRTGVAVYMNFGSFAIEDGSSFSPNRQIASAIAFGSLPTGIDHAAGSASQEPWQTLLFCPNPPSRTTPALEEPTESDHRGFGHPRDHLYLENFWMPIVQPYAISEPVATAGKINMNFQMVPFTYIERATGIHAAMKSTKLMAITPLSAGKHDDESGYDRTGGSNYKGGTIHDKELRYNVNVDATLTGFRHRFDQSDIFRSPSEICEIFLVPERIPGATYNSDAAPPPTDYRDMVRWWNGDPSDINRIDAFELTGDNLREAPYNQLYPRLTTRSNVFTVHYRAQVLRSGPGPAAQWDEAAGGVVAEFRGSTLLERYLDPNEESNIIGNTREGGQVTAGVGGGDFWHGWDRYYRFRIIRRQRFAP